MSYYDVTESLDYRWGFDNQRIFKQIAPPMNKDGSM